MFSLSIRFVTKICVWVVMTVILMACSIPTNEVDNLAGFDRIDQGGSYVYAYPAWSPDSKKIAYTRYDAPSPEARIPSTGDIFIFDLPSHQTTQLTHNDIEDLSPSWSPDGQQIVYVREYSDYHTGRDHPLITDTLRIMKPDGSGDRELYVCPFDCGMPAWSPDGTLIAFYSSLSWKEIGSTVKPPLDIDIVNIDGANLTRLTNGVNHALSPKWSPNGQLIAYEDLEQQQIRILDVQNQVEKVYNYAPVRSAYASITWFPDAAKIMFLGFAPDTGHLQLYQLDLASTKITPFVAYNEKNPLLPSQIDISPDGSRLMINVVGTKIFLGNLSEIKQH